jgi:hypothetical protein
MQACPSRALRRRRGKGSAFGGSSACGTALVRALPTIVIAASGTAGQLHRVAT